MRTMLFFHAARLCLICGIIPAIAVQAQSPVGTAFTYQGRLTNSGTPQTGTFDFRVDLYDSEIGGAMVGAACILDDVQVTNGLFTLPLNQYGEYGSTAFNGEARWLGLGVRPGNQTGAYEFLTPRQPLHATPYSHYSLIAPWSGLTGIPTGFADGVDNDTLYSEGSGIMISGTQISVIFDGNGSATTAARSDHTHPTGSHDHYGAQWDGNSPNPGLAVQNGNPEAGHGIWGQTTAPAQGANEYAGVHGLCAATGDTAGYGVAGSTTTNLGAGVAGLVGNGTASGVLGYTNSTTAGAAGVRGKSVAATGYGGFFETGDVGVEGGFGVVGKTGGGAYSPEPYSEAGIWGDAGGAGGIGVMGTSVSVGVLGKVLGNTTNGTGVIGYTESPNGTAIIASNYGGGYAMTAFSSGGEAIHGSSAGNSANSFGVVGALISSQNPDAAAVLGNVPLNPFGVEGATAVKGLNQGNGYGVYGYSASGFPGYFKTDQTENFNAALTGHTRGSGPGVKGMSLTGPGVLGTAGAGNGVTGESIHQLYYGVYGRSDFDLVEFVACRGALGAHSSGVEGWAGATGTYAGKFNGNVDVTGTLTAASKSFQIDHPQDPENQFLCHASIESSEMMNLYTGTAILDGDGKAIVELPRWFEALNKDFRYQLTAIGAPAPNLHVAEKIKEGRFTIAGGTAGLEVSWQVTGVRHDPYSEAHPLQVEKPKKETGLYQHPQLYGQPESKGIGYRPPMESAAASSISSAAAAPAAPDSTEEESSRPIH